MRTAGRPPSTPRIRAGSHTAYCIQLVISTAIPRLATTLTALLLYCSTALLLYCSTAVLPLSPCMGEGQTPKTCQPLTA
ncbi:hypothetical protein C3Z06_07635 [Cupriavidus metallidurans]|nr:hypothetical protein C3Z06_07635 [Cupriavidus metallidurans]